MCIPHIGTKRKLLTKAGSTNILVHIVATYDVFQACVALGYISPDIHAHVDTFAVYNGMVREYTENLIIRRILVVKCIIFCWDHL